MIDQKFMFPRVPVAVVDIGDTLEALLIRSMLESLGAVVTLHLPGTPEDFLTLIAGGELVHQHLIICGHGDENGFVFGDHIADIDTSMLVEGSLPPSVVAEHARLDGKIVLSTCCETGGKAFADAMVEKGGQRSMSLPMARPEGPMRRSSSIASIMRFLRASRRQRRRWSEPAPTTRQRQCSSATGPATDRP